MMTLLSNQYSPLCSAMVRRKRSLVVNYRTSNLEHKASKALSLAVPNVVLNSVTVLLVSVIIVTVLLGTGHPG